MSSPLFQEQSLTQTTKLTSAKKMNVPEVPNFSWKTKKDFETTKEETQRVVIDMVVARPLVLCEKISPRRTRGIGAIPIAKPKRKKITLPTVKADINGDAVPIPVSW